jgi:8-oxo-dGTP diphosphatase
MRDEATAQALDERPRVSVDVVLFTLAGRARAGRPQLQALLVRRDRPPFAGCWSLPGRLIGAGESLEAAAQRVIHDQAGAQGIYLEQLYTFGEPERDPRGRVITIAYYALVRADQVQVPPPADPVTVAWFPADAPPPLAFDHGHILAYAGTRLRNKIEYTDIAFQFLPDRFTLTHLRQVYEAVLDEPIDKRNFNRKVLGSGLLVETGRKQAGQAHRPAMLYSFERRSPAAGDVSAPPAAAGAAPEQAGGR